MTITSTGGVVGQEVLKSVTGKFHPIYQWAHFSFVEALPEEVDAANMAAQGNRCELCSVVMTIALG